VNGRDDTVDVEAYRLTPEENEHIFRTAIVPDELEPVPAREQPVVAILIGQPGAGKSATADEVRDAFGPGGFVEVDSDIYKPYHPRYQQILRLNDRLMAAAIRPDGRTWMAKVQTYLREHRLNALVHETAQNPDHLVATAHSYRAAGYQIAVIVLAVPEGLSRQGILDRYFAQIRDRGVGRLTRPENAAESYASIPEGAARLENEMLADVIAVFRRGLNPKGAAYWNEQTPTRWAHPPQVAEAVHAERARVTAHEYADFTARQHALRAVAPAEFADELATIERLVAPLPGAGITPPPDPAARAAEVFTVDVAEIVRKAHRTGKARAEIPPPITRPPGRSPGAESANTHHRGR